MFWRTLLFVLFFACTETASKESVQHTIAIIDAVNQAPQKAADLCVEIAEQEHQEQCFLIGFDLLLEHSIEQTESFCQQSPKRVQEECFFRLAEKSLSKKHCLQTTELQERCLMHLLQKRIAEATIASFEEGEEIAKKYSLPLHRGTQNVIYHYILSRDKIVYIDRCKTERYPQVCEEAAIILYLRRLRDLETNVAEPCQAITEFPHFEHARLKREHQYFQKRVCSGQSED